MSNARRRIVVLNPTCLDVLDADPRAVRAPDGIELVTDPAFRKLTLADADSVFAGADALVLPTPVRTLPHAEHMERHRNLRVLSIAASGFDWLDVGSATRHGIVVANAPVREGAEVVADMAWALMLAVARQVPYHHQAMVTGRSIRGAGTSGYGKTLGIIGHGNIGKATARRAAGFDVNVIATTPNPDPAYARAHDIELTSLDHLLARADFVSLHVRLDAKSKGMIGPREIGLMKRSAYLINTARDQLVDPAALTRAVVEGRIAGAALDDPPAEAHKELLSLPNVVFTPHLGNRAMEGMRAVFQAAVDNAVDALEGRKPRHVLNPEVYESTNLRLVPSPSGRGIG